MAQREIRVRAWDTEDNEIYIPEALGICKDGSYMPLRLCKDGNRAYKPHPIMQFTGLHDKNGKEVFDGDILANSHRDDDDNIYVCEYDNSQASFVFTSPFDGESLEQNDFVSDLVIIGNRYENEELLK